MRFFSALIFSTAIALGGCASSDFTVTLYRDVPATGVTERYAVDSKAHGTKTMILPEDTLGKQSTFSIDPDIVRSIAAVLRDKLPGIERIQLHETGPLTTGLTIDTHDVHTEVSWPNVDPPKLPTYAIDSLYHLMLRAEMEMR